MRIAIVNDVPLAVEALRRIVQSMPEHSVAWTAGDGREAVDKSIADRPDLILMDLIMPRLDGVAATREIMAKAPCAILVVTATVDGHARQVFEAMGWGARDAVETPSLGPNGDPAGARKLMAKIRMMAHLVDRARQPARAAEHSGAIAPGSAAAATLVAIGASTGGPAAIARVLQDLPPDLGSPIVIIQHIGAEFAIGLAHWLSRQSGRDVEIVRGGEHVRPGHVYLAATDDHLVMDARGQLAYDAKPEDYPYRPSVNEFFLSAMRGWRGHIVAVLLTGMGTDGARGLKSIRLAGGFTIAQDEASSIVYGMPKAAAENGGAAEILALDRIGSAIAAAVLRGSRQSVTGGGHEFSG